LKFNRKIIFKDEQVKTEGLATQIKSEDRKLIEIDGKKQWYFTKSIRIDGADHPVRIVILWERRNGIKAHKMLVSNRTYWEVGRILRVYRRRWRGTECFHRDGKQHPRGLGMGDCQLRKSRGQTRHMYMVFLAYSVMMRQLQQRRARAWALERLTTIGQACRAVLRQTLDQTISWVIERVQEDGWNSRKIKAHLALI